MKEQEEWESKRCEWKKRMEFCKRKDSVSCCLWGVNGDALR